LLFARAQGIYRVGLFNRHRAIDLIYDGEHADQYEACEYRKPNKDKLAVKLLFEHAKS
jgi:hypothetical protein